MSDKSVLLSIKPRWARAILNGEKEWEYRKKPPSIPPPYKVYLYATSPVQKILGEVVVDEELRDNRSVVIEMTIDDTPHTAKDINDYFGYRREYCALHIDKDSIEEYESPIIYGSHPPVNFEYVQDSEIAST